ncbi:tetratricopeptide repeat protein [Acuticoccus kandeliae]|uniref:tetratricopeptide repeat protein n=1 Tax=Acuticoccus kandeliae TaxID=2073160 RepID=UPI0014730034|nr:tetratricopeptide repeat protein [Acuticoccus kandeliae]
MEDGSQEDAPKSGLTPRQALFNSWRARDFAGVVKAFEARRVHAPEAYRVTTQSLRQLGRDDEALATLRDGRALFPENATLAFLAAQTETDEARVKSAVDDIITANDPTFRGRARLRRAQFAIAEGRTDDAIADLDAAVQHGEDGETVDLERAKALRLSAHINAGADTETLKADIAAFETPFSQPVQTICFQEIAAIANRGDDAALRSIVDLLLDRDPTAVRLRTYYVSYAFQRADTDRTTLTKHLDYLAKNESITNPHLIALHADLTSDGDPRAAITAMQEALAANPGDQRLRFGLATNLSNIGDIDEALAAFDVILEESSDVKQRREVALEAAITALKTGSQERADRYYEMLAENQASLTMEQQAILSRLVSPSRAKRLGVIDDMPPDMTFFDGAVRLYKTAGDTCVVWPFVGFLRAETRRRTIIDIWRERGVSVVTVDDPRRLSALGGIDPFFPARTQFNKALHELILAQGYKNHLAVGESLAGYTAILYGLETGGLGALSFSGGTRIPRLEDLPDDRGRAHLSYLRSIIPDPDLDLAPMLEQRPDFVVHNHYGSGSVADVASAERSAYLSNVVNTPWPHDNHASAGYLERTGQFTRVVDEFLSDALAS